MKVQEQEALTGFVYKEMMLGNSVVPHRKCNCRVFQAG
jgi:hypothetical protein